MSYGKGILIYRNTELEKQVEELLSNREVQSKARTVNGAGNGRDRVLVADEDNNTAERLCSGLS